MLNHYCDSSVWQVIMKIPDKLQIKTYLHELRTHFTGRQLEIKSVGDSPSLSSYVVNTALHLVFSNHTCTLEAGIFARNSFTLFLNKLLY